jgi:1L-myo-inositol 1-phosphate cytidylyltransferase / CDP-L-myo-inositol myo-inositolphosphotransferase
MDGTLNKPEVSTVDTAILLASSGVFDLTLATDRSPVSALTRIGGLTIFQRTVFTLQRAGISQILALVGEEEQHLRSLIHQDDRVQAAIRWLPVREFPPGDPQTWETLANEIKGSCLILGCHMVFAPSLVESLREGTKDGQVLVAIGRPGDEGWKANPGVVMRADPHPSGMTHRVVFQDQDTTPNSDMADGECRLAPAADLVVLPARLLGISGAWKTPAVGPIRLALEQAAAEGIVKTVSTTSQNYLDARGPKGLVRAEQMLFRSLQTVKGSLDGLVDRFVNRKLSGVLTRMFIKLGVSPNVITIISMLIGLAGAACFAFGSYELGIIGALLFQFSVVVDCCDGEVARLTFSESPFGQELDIIADNVVHMAIFAGIACGAYFVGPWQQSLMPIMLGAVAIIANAFSFVFVNRVRHLKANATAWRKIDPSQRTRLEFILGNVANRDFSVVVLLFACLAFLPWFLWLSALGGAFFSIMMGWTLRRALLPQSS